MGGGSPSSNLGPGACPILLFIFLCLTVLLSRDSRLDPPTKGGTSYLGV
jgi:hypothetical protein